MLWMSVSVDICVFLTFIYVGYARRGNYISSTESVQRIKLVERNAV
jgi:hypothetical protein